MMHDLSKSIQLRFVSYFEYLNKRKCNGMRKGQIN